MPSRASDEEENVDGQEENTPAPVDTEDDSPETPERASDAAEESAGGKEVTTEEEAPAEQPEFVSIRDVAKQRAQFDPATWADDETAAAEIVDGYKRYREIEPDYELYRRMKPQFDAFLAGGLTPQKQESQPEQPKWYTPPEFHESWLNDVELDEKGNLRPKEGRQVSPDRLAKVANYIQWRREVNERFLSNPQAAIQEMVAGQVEETARKLASEQVQEVRLQHEAQQFVDRHSQWLFRHNEQGERISDPITRKPVLTPEGQLFSQYFAQAEQMGLRTMADMQNYALAMLERHLLRQQTAQGVQGKPPATGKQAVKEALQKASRSPKRAASQANAREPGKMAQNPKADLGTQLLAAFKEAGIGDDDLD